MHYGKQAILSPIDAEADTQNCPLVITNSGFICAQNVSGSYINIANGPNTFLLIYQHKGSFRLSHKNKTFSEGTVLILRLDENFTIDYLKEPSNERYYIFFGGYECINLLRKFNLLDNYYFKVGDLSKTIPLFTFITNNFEVCGLENDIFRITKFLEILSTISETIHPFLGEHKNTIIQEIATYIDRNYNKPITLNSLCEEFHISPSTLNRGFINEKKQSPIQYLIDVRINNAKFMLINTHLMITDIALQVGFNDVFYFCRTFKNKCDMTPSQFRRIFLTPTK